MLQKQKNKFDDLSRKIDIVTRSRYGAGRRLYAHHWFTQVTLMLSSTGLILIPVLSLGGFNKNFAPRYVEVMQIIFAVLVLGYSFLLGLGNFSARSERLHHCGLRLTRLSLRLKPFLGTDGADAEYVHIQEAYCDILEDYENHSNGDYHSVLLEQLVRDGYPRRMVADPNSQDIRLQADESRWSYVLRFVECFVDRWLRRFKITAYRLLGYGHYIITIVCIYWWTYLMFRK